MGRVTMFILAVWVLLACLVVADQEKQIDALEARLEVVETWFPETK